MNGSLYYRYKDEWRVDNEAAQAGVLDGTLYRLMKNGVFFADEIPVENNVDYIAVTDTEVIKGRRSEVSGLS